MSYLFVSNSDKLNIRTKSAVFWKSINIKDVKHCDSYNFKDSNYLEQPLKEKEKKDNEWNF